MRIRTDGDYAYRKDTIEEAADFLGVNKTDAVVKSCAVAGKVLPQLEEALANADIHPQKPRKSRTPPPRGISQWSSNVPPC